MTMIVLVLVPVSCLAVTMVLAPDLIHALLRWWYGLCGHPIKGLATAPDRAQRAIRLAGLILCVAVICFAGLLCSTLVNGDLLSSSSASPT